MTTDERVKAIKAQGETVATAFRQLCDAEHARDRARSAECLASNTLTEATKAFAAAKAKLDELFGGAKP